MMSYHFDHHSKFHCISSKGTRQSQPNWVGNSVLQECLPFRIQDKDHRPRRHQPRTSAYHSHNDYGCQDLMGTCITLILFDSTRVDLHMVPLLLLFQRRGKFQGMTWILFEYLFHKCLSIHSIPTKVQRMANLMSWK